MQIRRLQLQGLKHHDRSSDVAAGIVRDGSRNLWRQLKVLPRGNFLEQVGKDLLFGSGDTDLEAARLERHDHLGETFTIGDNAASRHVCLHRSAQTSLCRMRQLVELVDDDHLERLLLILVELLAASDLLDQLLHDDSVVVVGLARGHLQMIERAEHDAAAGRARTRTNLVLFLLAPDLVHRVRVVKSLQHALGQSALAGARRAIEKDMREVVARRQLLQHIDRVLVQHVRRLKRLGAVLLHPESLLVLQHLACVLVGGLTD